MRTGSAARWPPPPDELALCRELGAQIALDYHDDWVAALKEATGGRGVDVILDIMGAKYLDANLRSLAVGGRQVTIGLQGGVKGELNLGLLLNKRGTVTATSLRFRPTSEKAAICARVAETVWPLVEIEGDPDGRGRPGSPSSRSAPRTSTWRAATM